MEILYKESFQIRNSIKKVILFINRIDIIFTVIFLEICKIF
jgi:hypothetical protein